MAHFAVFFSSLLSTFNSKDKNSLASIAKEKFDIVNLNELFVSMFIVQLDKEKTVTDFIFQRNLLFKSKRKSTKTKNLFFFKFNARRNQGFFSLSRISS